MSLDEPYQHSSSTGDDRTRPHKPSEKGKFTRKVSTGSESVPDEVKDGEKCADNIRSAIMSLSKLLDQILDEANLSPREAEILAPAFRASLNRIIGDFRSKDRESSGPVYGDGVYEQSRLNSLPKNPPKYEDRPDRAETPVDFYQRVWLKYEQDGILYQDDISRLGDEKLLRAIRTYCQKRGLTPSEYLPPPRHARTERILREAPKDSPDYAAAKARLNARLRAQQRSASDAGPPDTPAP